MDLILEISFIICVLCIAIYVIIVVREKNVLKKYINDKILYLGKSKSSIYISFGIIIALFMVIMFYNEMSIINMLYFVFLVFHIINAPYKLVIKESGIGSFDILGRLTLFFPWENIEKWNINKYDTHLFVYTKGIKNKNILIPKNLEEKIEKDYSSKIRDILISYCGEKIR